MNRNRSTKFQRAIRLLNRGLAREALSLADELVASEEEGDKLAGYFCRGAVYEDGGTDLSPDIDKAIYNYRQASLIVPDAVTFNCLAKMNLRKGDEKSFDEAFKFLNEAAKIEETPDVMLGFAEYYKSKPQPNYNAAKSYYIRAAKEGRIAAFAGLADVCRSMNQPVRAIVFACLTIVLTPILWLLIGPKARDVF